SDTPDPIHQAYTSGLGESFALPQIPTLSSYDEMLPLLRAPQHQQRQQRCAWDDARHQDVFARAMVQPADRAEAVEHRQAKLGEGVGVGDAAGRRILDAEA